MPTSLPIGPYRVLKTLEGADFPYYIIPFDADGECEGPKTRDHLLANAAAYSDVFLFSHGWNNDWSVATQRYEELIQSVQELRKDHGLAMPAGFKPLLVGIFWPSQALEWFESETGPQIAGGDPATVNAQAGEFRSTISDIAAQLPKERRARFYELAQAATLEDADARELAAILATLVTADDEGISANAPDAQDLMAAAKSMAEDEEDEDYDAVGGVDSDGAAAGPQAAFGIGDVLGALDPRNLLKPFTVWTMKDRAGKVGAFGVSKLLTALLKQSNARVHLLGHSYGCKVVMTAACYPETLPRKVESALLLQPAVSQYVFAQKVPKRNAPGGFIRALTRFNQPILSTFSSHDVPLTKIFHVSVRRKDDLGELQFAGDGSPSDYGALGGFGPQATAARIVDIQAPVKRYDLSIPERVIGLRSSSVIRGHGDINHPETCWALYCLVTANV